MNVNRPVPPSARASISALCLLLLLVLGAGCGNGDSTAQIEQRLRVLEAGAPGVGSLMSGVQLHFAKLRFAASAGNWELAAFELHEVEENLEKAVLLRPEENGVDLGGVTAAFRQTQLGALKAAAEAGDPAAFDSAYAEAVATCNGCHAATGRPFIVIVEPTAPPVPNQRWEPPPAGAPE